MEIEVSTPEGDENVSRFESEGKSFETLILLANQTGANFYLRYSEVDDVLEAEFNIFGGDQIYQKRCVTLEYFVGLVEASIKFKQEMRT